MKRFLPLLLILSCEDSDSNSNVEFSDVWMNHSLISVVVYFEDTDSIIVEDYGLWEFNNYNIYNKKSLHN